MQDLRGRKALLSALLNLLHDFKRLQRHITAFILSIHDMKYTCSSSQLIRQQNSALRTKHSSCIYYILCGIAGHFGNQMG